MVASLLLSVAALKSVSNRVDIQENTFGLSKLKECLVTTMAKQNLVTLDLNTLGSETVKLIVGPKRKTFVMHKKLLCDKFEYFFKAFNGGFKEASEGEIYLPHDNVEVIEVFVNYLYRDNLPDFPNPAVGTRFPDTRDGCYSYCALLYKVFHFAEKICAEKLANQVIDSIREVELAKNHISALSHVKQTYANTSEKSPLRTYAVATIVAVICYAWGRDLATEHQETFAAVCRDIPDFGKDFFAFLTQYHDTFYKEKIDPRKRESLDPCFFHRHSGNAICHLKS